MQLSKHRRSSQVSSSNSAQFWCRIKSPEIAPSEGQSLLNKGPTAFGTVRINALGTLDFLSTWRFKPFSTCVSTIVFRVVASLALFTSSEPDFACTKLSWIETLVGPSKRSKCILSRLGQSPPNSWCSASEMCSESVARHSSTNDDTRSILSRCRTTSGRSRKLTMPSYPQSVSPEPRGTRAIGIGRVRKTSTATRSVVSLRMTLCNDAAATVPTWASPVAMQESRNPIDLLKSAKN
mmetsp:Transcript_19654/g.36377  ORF Transcript_19654/g.36377 Transcript_19654/m.36377 type:complete len:237 (-) Transcript_19654:41-751(-)